jgi:hypothetical protein
MTYKQIVDAMFPMATSVSAQVDKEMVGLAAAQLRALRPPDPYKGKGIRYSDERLRMKPGWQRDVNVGRTEVGVRERRVGGALQETEVEQRLRREADLERHGSGKADFLET